MAPTLDVHPFTHVRRMRGWGKSELARKMRHLGAEMGIYLATNRSTVWKWEERGQEPDPEAQLVLSRLLGVPAEALAAGWPAWLPAWEVPGLTEPWTAAGAVNVLNHLARSGDMDRRGFLTITGTALTGVAASWAAASAAHAQDAQDQQADDTARLNYGGTVDEATLQALERRVDTLRTLDDAAGGARILTLATADLDAVTVMLTDRSYSAEAGQKLHLLAAQIAFLAGWMAHDTGLRSRGQLYCTTALRSAKAAGDDALGAYILAEMSGMTAEAGDPAAGATLAETAAEKAPVGSGHAMCSYLNLQQASAFARVGQRRSAARALNAAHAHWDRHGGGKAAPWLAWYGPGQLASGEARVLHRSGDFGRATEALEKSVRASETRDRAVRSGRLAEVRLDGGDLDGALDAAGYALGLLEGPVTSARARDNLEDFAGRVAGHPQARDFTERLHALPA